MELSQDDDRERNLNSHLQSLIYGGMTLFSDRPALWHANVESLKQGPGPGAVPVQFPDLSGGSEEIWL